MSLKVWLPLTGTLENKGCSNITVTNNGATINTNGKIGSCYLFDGTNDYISGTYTSTATMSFCAWVNFPTIKSAHVFDARTNGGTGYQPMYITASTIQIGNSGSGYANFSYSFSTNTWYHICVTHDSSIGKCYINGTLLNSSTTAKGYANGTCNFTIGSRCNQSNYSNVKVNDIRIYDHCLSAAEVHEISQGLVLHYKLDNNGHRNLFTSDAARSMTIASGGTAVYSSYTYIDPIIKNNGIFKAGTEYTITYDYIVNSLTTGTSVYIYSQLNTSRCSPAYAVTEIRNGVTSGHVVESFQVTSAQASYSNTFRVRWRINNGTAGDSITISNVRFYLGRPEDINYISDCSGYGHNGTITGKFTIQSNTPRYTSSTSIDSNDAMISTTGLYTDEDKFSFNIWCNSSSLPPAAKYFNVRLNNTLFFNFGCTSSSNGKGQFLVFNGSNYKGPNGAFYLSTNGWHMWSGTYDGTTVKLYKDGEQISSVSSATNYSSTITDKEQFLGTGTAAQLGLASDIRLYCTALSAADIKQLYEVGAKVDNKQNLHIYESIESSSTIKLTKRGQAKAGEFQENTNTKFYETDQIIETNNLIEL